MYIVKEVEVFSIKIDFNSKLVIIIVVYRFLNRVDNDYILYIFFNRLYY